jgi:hypothetical protein
MRSRGRRQGRRGSAVNLDIQRATRHDRNLVVPLVLVVVLVILALVLRAIISPLLLVATVVLSFAAALGVSALVFDHVFGFAGADPAFPLWTFVFLVALGTDNSIFLMTRVHEEARRHGTRRGALIGPRSSSPYRHQRFLQNQPSASAHALDAAARTSGSPAASMAQLWQAMN